MKSRLIRVMEKAKEELFKEITCFWPITGPRKVLFDHLPKCGGSSLSQFLEMHYPRRTTFSIDGRDPAGSIAAFRNLPQSKRHGYDLIQGHQAHMLLEHVHPECIRVTVLRDPVDRIISHYYYARREKNHYLHATLNHSNMSLAEYVTTSLSGELCNWYTTHFSGIPLKDAVQNPDEAVEKAMDVIIHRYDIIGFLDDFDSLIEVLRRRAWMHRDFTRQKVNVTKGRPTVADIGSATVELIKETNKLDTIFFEKINAAVAEQKAFELRRRTIK